MTWQNLAGAGILLAVFVSIFVAFALQVGWKASSAVFGGSAVVTLVILLGIHLMLS